MPFISLPKGGGAVRSMGEKLAANPVTGTGTMSVPITVSPGRSGFDPELSLSYDSAAGNGPFGFGWFLSTPTISRKTEKGLPKYLDAEESDVYVLSGAEDLVPVLRADGSRFEDTTTDPGFVIHRYRPRVEGLFARIERWTERGSGDIHWRSISAENVTTIYGQDRGSRIFDPAGTPRAEQRVFSWLISQSYDDKGNVIVYEYAAENDDQVTPDLAHERHRVRTANRYLKRIKYGNHISRLIEPDLGLAQWLFEVVFDYGEGHYEELPADEGRPPDEQHARVRASSRGDGRWGVRPDPFSSYRPGFELRTYRRCRRILMFHRFAELGAEPCLVRSTEFDYADLAPGATIDEELSHQGSTRLGSFLRSITPHGHVRDPGAPIVERGDIRYVTYRTQSMPPLELEYSKPRVADTVEQLDESSLENLPAGLDGETYSWADLDGEGVPGILAHQAGTWFYKPNLGEGSFGPLETVATQPSSVSSGRPQLLDLDGGGQLAVVEFATATPGFYERTQRRGWHPQRPFRQLPRVDWDEPNLRFVDLSGDGHADVLITEHEALTWYPSLAQEGFAAARQVRKTWDEEAGPRLVFADGTDAVYLADMCGDGLIDLVRVRDGELCYWPNLGYGRFGAKVTMDDPPRFDHPEHFDPQRVRLADIDGSGTNDLIYLGRDGVRLFFNLAGNGWSDALRLERFPQLDDLATVTTADLEGNGTACLVWSSPLPGHGRRPLMYVDLMGGQKPHLLIRSSNNLGAETRFQYAASSTFYLADKRAGRPWLTRIPFPVHVVERIETFDHISGNRFVTRYAYHHGDFDGEERELRGFGMVERWDSEHLAASSDETLPAASNVDAASHVPPVHTKTWFHTGAYLGRGRISKYFAGLEGPDDSGEYFREPGLTDAEAGALLLEDTVLPTGLTPAEEREACRALKGSMLRQEVYALDGTAKAALPYRVSEQNFTVRRLQARGENRHAVFLSEPRETLTYHYERNPVDPRVEHSLTLQLDDYGHVLRELTIGYGRRQADPDLPLPADREQQTRTLITYDEHRFTRAVDRGDGYRVPLPCETRTFELTGYEPENGAARFSFEQWRRDGFAALTGAEEIPFEQVVADPAAGRRKRLIEHTRTLYRKDDLSALLPLGDLEPLALTGESYELALTPGLLAVFEEGGASLLADPAAALGGRGGYVAGQDLVAAGLFPATDAGDPWWVPGGRVFLSPSSLDTAVQEQIHALSHFFLPHRYRDPFHRPDASSESFVQYDAYDLLVLETRDALGNRSTVGERLIGGEIDPARPGNDYRVLQPRLLMDANRNRTEAAFDALGQLVGLAVMGAPEQGLGDSLAGFEADLTAAATRRHLSDPLADPAGLLGRASRRLLYDPFAYMRSQESGAPQPTVIYSLTRETHVADLDPGEQTRFMHGFVFTDGFGREIQSKQQAEPGPLTDAGPGIDPRWLASGWKIFNNKGQAVREYQPFFSAGHAFEPGVEAGVSSLLCYDPVGRVVATLFPDHSYEKAVFDPWQQATYDANDTVLFDPATDEHVAGFLLHADGSPRLPPATYRPTWHALRTEPAHAADFAAAYPEAAERGSQTAAAEKAAAHADTPKVTYFDTLGRAFLTTAHNRVASPGHPLDGTEKTFTTRLELDIEGNELAVRDAMEQAGDAAGRIVTRSVYDLLGRRIHESNMDAGERWTLPDAGGQVMRTWDSRGHGFRTEYDPLRRPVRTFLTGIAAGELLIERRIYGEQHPEAEARNLREALYLHLDQAGAASTESQDFKGNVLHSTRRLATDYKAAIDYAGVDAAVPRGGSAAFEPPVLEAALAPLLEGETYRRSTSYDGLDRPTTMTTPHAAGMRASIIRHRYNEADLLERIDVNLEGATANGAPLWTPFITQIDYDAMGLRRRIDYGNGVSTFYTYDPLTFRLTRLRTRRNPDAFAGDCPQPAAAGWPGCQVQNLRYTYDPVGNITHLRDLAQQAIYFKNRRVEPSAEYTYDAVYRLVAATGREHLGQVGGVPIVHSHGDERRTGRDWSASDGRAMGTYLERYVYDAVGNMLTLQHRGTDPAAAGWQRSYRYAEASSIEPAKRGNRLSSTTVDGSAPERYGYDAHGNMSLPHLALMRWNHDDQLQATARQVADAGQTTWYRYDASGQRVRKVTERGAGAGVAPKRLEERIYLGGFEIDREYGADGQTVTLAKERLHLFDDEERVALVEARTQGDDGSPARLRRYQVGNHLGSANLELDEQARIVSYEEYTPLGSTSYQAVRAQTETPKRYRYAGKERDEESGLYYYGARYYAPWLGRWTSCDPAGLIDGVNVYAYVNNNSIVESDLQGLEGEGADEPPKGGHRKNARKRTRQKHQDADERRKREQKKKQEKERNQERKKRRRNPKKETDAERKKRQNRERKERFRKQGEEERKDRERDPEQERRERERRERERRRKEMERKARERREQKERERKEQERKERERKEQERKERERKEKEKIEQERKERERKEREQKELERLKRIDKPLEKPSLLAEAFGILVLAAGVFIVMRGGWRRPTPKPTAPPVWRPAPAH